MLMTGLLIVETLDIGTDRIDIVLYCEQVIFNHFKDLYCFKTF